jgi:hypothetical protein
MPSHDVDTIDPFVLLDEFHSTDPDEYKAGFPTHPHRGMETITYMITGAFEHRDSRGGGGMLTDGCVQWMTAGRGILHSEMPKETKDELWGFQLWLALPAKDKMCEPRYQHLSSKSIPEVNTGGLSAKVISGSFAGISGPAHSVVPATYLDVTLFHRGDFEYHIPTGHHAFCYIRAGSVATGGSVSAIDEGTLVEFTPGAVVRMRPASDAAQFLFLDALPVNEPIVHGGPFVMNTEEEIEQAFRDYQDGKLG